MNIHISFLEILWVKKYSNLSDAKYFPITVNIFLMQKSGTICFILLHFLTK